MITVVSGTNREGARTLVVARIVERLLWQADREAVVLDLGQLPPELFDRTSYATKPPAFAPFQEAISRAEGILLVVPEYNGSFPGVLKYFIDMLDFPSSLAETPVALVGLSAGRWGGLRAVEQLAMVLAYRHAHLYGRRVLIPGIGNLLDEESGRLRDDEVRHRLAEMVRGFAGFCARLA